jgi:hypothetical protein
VKPNENLQTHHAIAAHDLAEAITASLRNISVGPGAYSPELTAPEGPSTGGGLQSLQHLRLVPRSEGFPTLVVGSADQTLKKAELRSFDYVDRVYRERFNKPVPLDEAQYGEFLSMARNLFEVMHLNPRVVGPPVASEPPPAARTFPVLGVVGVVGLVLVIVAFLVFKN